MRRGSLIFLSVMFLVMIVSGQVFGFPISTEPLVGEFGIAGAGDGNGNFLIAIERVPHDTNGPITAKLIQSDGTILKSIDTGRIGCCATGVAFDGTNYLMIWEDSNENSQPDYSYQQVWGLFIDTDGNPVGEPFPISSTGVSVDGIKHLAFDGVGKYLVVYTIKGEERYIAGTIVDTNGNKSNEFRISSGSGRMPSVDFDGTNFLVAWVEDSQDKTVMARFVAPDGTLGSEITVDSDPRCSDNPLYVKFGLDSYLIAYSEQRGTGSIPCSQAGFGNWDLKGVILGTDGSIIEGPFYIKQGGSQVVPTIGFDGERFLVAYNDYSTDTSNYGVCDSTEGTCWDIRARYVSTEGTLIGNPFSISAVAGIDVGGIAGYDSTAGFLALINKCGNRIFSSKCDVYGQFISASQSYIGLLTPGAGEVIASGSNYLIKWTASDDISSVILRLSMDNGATWTTIANNVTGTGYNWSVPTPLNNKTKCLITITGFNSRGIAVASDKTDAPFIIEVIKLTSPNGGESLKSGSQHNITWRTNKTKNPISKVILSYTLDGGLTWKSIPNSLSITNPGTYTHPWTVPAVSTTKTKCRVRVVLKDSAGNVIGSDLSDGFFTINPQP